MSTLSNTDFEYLKRSIKLAEGGRGSVSPNPVVGAVVAAGDHLIAEGYHAIYGQEHAEVVALSSCEGSDLSSATLYVSLEPCCHHGKQPPCTEAILASGIRRVVVAIEDPSEKAAGRGLGILRDEGIDVVLLDQGSELAFTARMQNQSFRKHAKSGRPHVMFKAAMTLDGKVATHTGDSKWISNQTSRELAHRWRSECDAVVVGIGTALSDDPQLTARIEGVLKQPRRVVFDSEARLPLDSQLVKHAPEIPLTVVISRAAPEAASSGLERAGAEVITAVGENEPARIVSGLQQLGDEGVTSVLLEGGPRLAGAFFNAGEIDELRLFLAPILLGGRTARSLLEGEGPDLLSDAVKAATVAVEQSADDLLIKARLKEW